MELMPPNRTTGAQTIPLGWCIKRVQDLGEVVTGGTPNTSAAEYWEGQHPWITPTDITDSRDLSESGRMLTDAGLKVIRNLPANSVLVTCIASIGKNAILRKDGGCNQQINAVIPNEANSPEFLYYMFEAAKNYLQSNAGITATSIVSKAAFQELEFLLPLLPEQRAIATALSDVDALIAGLERLITKKRDIKQAAMQQLLTGQTRLPGFSGEWDRAELKHLVSTPITDGPHMTPTFYDVGVPFLSVNNLVDNRIDLTDLRYISKEDDLVFAKKCKPKVGDVLLGKAASVGKVAIVEEDFDFNIWSPIALVRAGDAINAKFLYYQLLSADCAGQIALLTNSSSQGNIGMGDIERLQISYPGPDEQTAIATVLSDMDADLAAIESRLAKTRAIKQGMMQELLTGRTRLLCVMEPA